MEFSETSSSDVVGNKPPPPPPPPPRKPAKPPKPVVESGLNSTDKFIESCHDDEIIDNNSLKHPVAKSTDRNEASDFPKKIPSVSSLVDEKAKDVGHVESVQDPVCVKQDSNTVNTSKMTKSSIWNVVKSMPMSFERAFSATTSSLTETENTTVVYDDIQKSGNLFKMNREGAFEKNLFLLTKSLLIYFKPSVGFKIAEDTKSIKRIEIPSNQSYKSMLLSTTIVTILGNEELKDVEGRGEMFKVLSKKKSFYVRSRTEERKMEWLSSLQLACKEAQEEVEGSIMVDMDQMAPVWVPSEPDCQICKRPFTFLFRRHHCRNCGKCVCEFCSKDKVRILRLDPTQLFKVCNPCSIEIKESRVYGH